MILPRASLLLLLLTAGVEAQPSNDQCSTATSLVVNGEVVGGTTTGAASDTTSGCGVTKQAPEVFYQITGNGRKMTATTCFDQTDFSTALSLWNPNLCAGSCNQGSVADAECGNVNGARVTWDSDDGQVYTLVVFGRQADSTGNFAVGVTDFPNPANDCCPQAQSLVVNGNEVVGTTVNATTSTAAGCGVTKKSPEVFYQITGNGRKMTATTCSNQTDFATGLAVWNPNLCTGSCNQGASADTECTSANGARVTWDSAEGKVYTLVVFGRQEGTPGNFGIKVADFVNPPNDYCPQAQSLLVNGNEVVGTTMNATTRSNSGCGVTKKSPEVFYQVTGNSRKMTATTCSNQTDFATGLAVWNPNLCTGSCNDGSSTDVECGDSNGARVTWDSTEGKVYTLVVFGRQEATTGNFGISVTDFVSPPNDLCPQATPLLPNGAEFLSSTINATTRTTAGCGVRKQAPEVFFQVAGTGGNLTATTCSSSTNFETGLALWNPNLCTGSCNQGASTDTECGNANGARVTWLSTADRVYTLVVFGRQADVTGNFGIQLYDPANPPAPTVAPPPTVAVPTSPPTTASTPPTAAAPTMSNLFGGESISPTTTSGTLMPTELESNEPSLLSTGLPTSLSQLPSVAPSSAPSRNVMTSGSSERVLSMAYKLIVAVLGAAVFIA